ncbi:hypothetical protein SAMN05443247_07266 [Bradyrhizobium erythrophlei]|nr:hypothetical protein SAMN05443247_07266 [Bradyrhizobium erythrophlei]
MPPSPRANRPKPTEPRFLVTPSIKEWLRKTILTWRGPTIEWEDVRRVVQKKYPRGIWKRQSLAKHAQAAFDATKRRLEQERADEAEARAKAGKAAKRAKPKSGTDEFYAERIIFLEERVHEFATENDRLKQQFVRWQRNAFAAGMTMQQLDRPVLPIDRGQADE